MRGPEGAAAPRPASAPAGNDAGGSAFPQAARVTAGAPGDTSSPSWSKRQTDRRPGTRGPGGRRPEPPRVRSERPAPPEAQETPRSCPQGPGPWVPPNAGLGCAPPPRAPTARPRPPPAPRAPRPAPQRRAHRLLHGGRHLGTGRRGDAGGAARVRVCSAPPPPPQRPGAAPQNNTISTLLPTGALFDDPNGWGSGRKRSLEGLGTCQLKGQATPCGPT